MAQEIFSGRADYPIPSVPYPDELTSLADLPDHEVLFVKGSPKGGSAGETGTFTDVLLGRSTYLNKEAEAELRQLNATGFIEKMILALDRPRTSNIDKQVAFLTKTYLGTDPYRKVELMHTYATWQPQPEDRRFPHKQETEGRLIELFASGFHRDDYIESLSYFPGILEGKPEQKDRLAAERIFEALEEKLDRDCANDQAVIHNPQERKHFHASIQPNLVLKGAPYYTSVNVINVMIFTTPETHLHEIKTSHLWEALPSRSTIRDRVENELAKRLKLGHDQTLAFIGRKIAQTPLIHRRGEWLALKDIVANGANQSLIEPLLKKLMSIKNMEAVDSNSLAHLAEATAILSYGQENSKNYFESYDGKKALTTVRELIYLYKKADPKDPLYESITKPLGYTIVQIVNAKPEIGERAYFKPKLKQIRTQLNALRRKIGK